MIKLNKVGNFLKIEQQDNGSDIAETWISVDKILSIHDYADCVYINLSDDYRHEFYNITAKEIMNVIMNGIEVVKNDEE